MFRGRFLSTDYLIRMSLFKGETHFSSRFRRVRPHLTGFWISVTEYEGLCARTENAFLALDFLFQLCCPSDKIFLSYCRVRSGILVITGSQVVSVITEGEVFQAKRDIKETKAMR